MKTLYFDLVAGISGDMTVAAMLDLGLSLEVLKKELSKIDIQGFSLSKSYVQRGHAQALQFRVSVKKEKNYSYGEIIRLVRSSRLPGCVKENVLKIYDVLKNAEVKVHGHRHADIRFHQLGEVDSLVDIVAICIGLEKLKVKKVAYGVVPIGMKVAPATMELLKQKQVYFTNFNFENLTPTGMAFLTACGTQAFKGADSVFVVSRQGTGAGLLDATDCANVVRVLELEDKSAFHTDTIHCCQANIDDMNPQVFEHVFDLLLAAGALDVYVENIIMKKSRPGFLLTVLSNEENLGKITRLVLNETTTSGVRYHALQRVKLPRSMRYIDYKGRAVRVKCFQLESGDERLVPEYEDCRQLAVTTGIPLLKIINVIQRKAELKWRSQD